MQGSIMVISGLHVVAATASIVLFLIYRDVALRAGRGSSKFIGMVTGLSVMVTAYLLGRTYLSVFGPFMTALVIVVWIITVLLSELYFIERPLEAKPIEEH